jgi:hypothetical protein
MASPSTQVASETASMSRLAWVLNKSDQPYRAEFQSIDITIPADRQKIAKHVRDGGNLMEYLAACKFRSDYKQPQSFAKDGTPIFGTKELYIQELTDEELEAIAGKTKADLKKQALVEEKKVRRTMKAALDKIPNKVLAPNDEDE